MRALQRLTVGHAGLGEADEPQPGADEVVVDVLRAGVNPFDTQVLRGDIAPVDDGPLTLGAEATGRHEGRLVLVAGGGLGAARHGTFAARVAVPATSLIELPEGTDPDAAASVGVAGRTAWRAVHQLAQVSADDRVLVLGGSGGVGQFAAQLAVAAGAQVVAQVGTPSKTEPLRSLGLDVLLASTPDDLAPAAAELSPTVVLDPLGGGYLSAVVPALAARARVVTYGVLAGPSSTIDLKVVYGRGVSVLGTSGGTTSPEDNREALLGALSAALDGKVRTTNEVLPLSNGAAAFDRLRERTVVGKLLLDPHR